MFDYDSPPDLAEPGVLATAAGSALLRNVEAVHIVLPGPRAVSSLVFCLRKACDG